MMDVAGVARAAEENTVFGRITPEQKLDLIRHLQRAGHYVAMIGDGVNDVLALKRAEVGVAMEGGSQATRAVADLVLLGDSFAVLPIQPVASASRRAAAASRAPRSPAAWRAVSSTASISFCAAAAAVGELAADEVHRLDAVRALVDRRHPHVAPELGDPGLLDVAHAAEDLHGEARHLAADVGAEGLGDRGEEGRRAPARPPRRWPWPSRWRARSRGRWRGRWR